MTFEEQGYLSDDVREMERIIHDLFRHPFQISLQVNALAHKVLKEAFVDSEDMQQVLATCLLMRLLDGHQSIHILSSKGLTVCSKVILRSNVEALVILKYIAASVDNFQQVAAVDAVGASLD